ncbi:hypothetical protein ACQ4WP_27000 [Janthinobacterium sp. GB4P2]|uniref:hypothetical protein n=1 Tax=Janthinobacterium sp. GB4P2 TaxID=3424189 RepID=UPI003F232FA6
MATAEFLLRLRRRRTPQEMTAIIADVVPPDPPTHQDLIDQLDIDVVRQFQRMLDVDAD